MKKELSFDEKIGQRFMFGVNNQNIDDVIYLIKNNYIGSVLLYKKNYSSYKEMLDIIKKIKNANKNNKYPLIVAIDQEGGYVNRFPNEIVNLKNIYDTSRVSKELVSDNGRVISEIFKNSGINMNLSPVLDIYNKSKSKALYKRTFYGDIDNINDCAKRFIKEFDKNNIITVCKHFPGHGITKYDSHYFVPYIFNYKAVLNRHVLPFKEAIDNGVSALMIGHFVIRKLSGFLPTSISRRFINNILREECNYNGVIITDEINMLSRNVLYKFNCIKKAINAGNDIVLVKVKNKAEAINVLNEAKGVANIKLLDESVNRIINLKEKYKIDDNTNFDGINVEEVNKEIKRINSRVNVE